MMQGGIQGASQNMGGAGGGSIANMHGGHPPGGPGYKGGMVD